MKEILIKIFTVLGLAYWVEIHTDYPRCTYYFGPFLSKKEAEVSKLGYLEDLDHEGAKGISVTIKRCKPNSLTIFDEKEDMGRFRAIPTFRSQLS
ncbi:Domain of unknown function DUF1816 [Gloeothece citriformis PCC 7424]|uniref:DUF1816 domain-containing protein n=1 Tax=Gloeothece citriformis (strain PCC 7424) TaxID=65393 RepID=B7KLE4_GLOC7|nr:DUF1816 domain-containing protein [Gloeothece citriformis]ACK72516.1 Domain of unknown function DUF1816 [Gloeothece citriformis PCC 7424]